MMMIKKIFAVLGLAFLLTVVPAGVASASVFDGSKDAVCSGIALEEGKTCDQVTAGKKDPAETVKVALNIFTAIIGIIAVVVMMIAGVKYVTSQGESNQVNSAKNTILYAAIGLVVAMLAQVIVRFVLARF